MAAPVGPMHPLPASSGSLRWAGYLLGFALGGFFDGILLHQVLQWHHLLSGLEAAAFQDLRVQVLADGLFHVLMYIVAVAGLLLLWRARREFSEGTADRLLLANALIGFGTWHFADTLLSHWILGIHRIRMDAENVLLWDVLWFFAFGVLFLVVGWWLRRTTGSGGAARGAGRAVAPIFLALAVLTAGPVAALPSPNSSAVLVVFRPGMSEQDVFAAVASIDGRIVLGDVDGGIWAVDIPDTGHRKHLFRYGALWVTGAFLPIGCFSRLRAA